MCSDRKAACTSLPRGDSRLLGRETSPIPRSLASTTRRPAAPAGFAGPPAPARCRCRSQFHHDRRGGIGPLRDQLETSRSIPGSGEIVSLRTRQKRSRSVVHDADRRCGMELPPSPRSSFSFDRNSLGVGRAAEPRSLWPKLLLSLGVQVEDRDSAQIAEHLAGPRALELAIGSNGAIGLGDGVVSPEQPAPQPSTRWRPAGDR